METLKHLECPECREILTIDYDADTYCRYYECPKCGYSKVEGL